MTNEVMKSSFLYSNSLPLYNMKGFERNPAEHLPLQVKPETTPKMSYDLKETRDLTRSPQTALQLCNRDCLEELKQCSIVQVRAVLKSLTKFCKNKMKIKQWVYLHNNKRSLCVLNFIHIMT